jgi:hypothetical protein
MTKVKIIDIYLKIIKNKKMTPNRNDLLKYGVTKDMYRHHFGTMDELKDQARIKSPDEFKNLLDEQIFTPKIFKKLKGEVAKFKKFVITTAVSGMPIHKGFYNNLKAYCKKNNALLLILPSSDPAIKGWELDGSLSSEHIVFDDLALNNNLFISTFKTSAKQTNPLTGIKRIGQRERSMIISSPKQFLEYVPTANDKYSHALMTTGAITLPTYRSTERYMSQRTAYIAEFDHKMGAIIVDIKDNKYFQFRQIQAEYGSGKLIDLGDSYSSSGIKNERAEGLILGDIHVGHTDPNVQIATDKLISDLKPKRIFWHDIFEGESVNHHIEHQLITKSKRTVTLEKEIILVKDYIESMKKKHPYVNEWIIVRSNHDDFLDRYLQSGSYVEDSINSKFAHKLALAKLDHGRMALEAALELVGLNKTKVNFLNINSSYKVKNIECGVHGHMGLNGSKSGTNASMEIGYGAGVFGHSHTAGILRDVYRVGTSTKLRMGYNHGASNWTHTHCLIYSNGSRQLINIINKEYK